MEIQVALTENPIANYVLLMGFIKNGNNILIY